MRGEVLEIDVVHLSKMLDAVRKVRAATAQLEQELLTALAVNQAYGGSEEIDRTGPDEWMTQGELADRLKISRTTVRGARRVADGSLVILPD